MSRRIEPVFTIADLDVMPEDGNRYEVIEGELFVSRAPSVTHQIVLINIISSIQTHLGQYPLGFLIPGPGVVFSEFSGVIPDLIFVRNDRRDEVISGERIVAAPDLIIEIISPGPENQRRDRVTKRRLYGKYMVKEYCVVDPSARTVEVYALDGQTLRLVNTFAEEDRIVSTVLPAYRASAASFFSI